MKLSNGRHVYTATGRGNGTCSADTENDIISEWATEETPKTQGPIREVRRREIVPGVYGIVNVYVTEGCIDIDVEHDGLTAEQAREAAHIFNQLAEYLEEQG